MADKSFDDYKADNYSWITLEVDPGNWTGG